MRAAGRPRTEPVSGPSRSAVRADRDGSARGMFETWICVVVLRRQPGRTRCRTGRLLVRTRSRPRVPHPLASTGGAAGDQRVCGRRRRRRRSDRLGMGHRGRGASPGAGARTHRVRAERDQPVPHHALAHRPLLAGARGSPTARHAHQSRRRRAGDGRVARGRRRGGASVVRRGRHPGAGGRTRHDRDDARCPRRGGGVAGPLARGQPADRAAEPNSRCDPTPGHTNGHYSFWDPGPGCFSPATTSFPGSLRGSGSRPRRADCRWATISPRCYWSRRCPTLSCCPHTVRRCRARPRELGSSSITITAVWTAPSTPCRRTGSRRSTSRTGCAGRDVTRGWVTFPHRCGRTRSSKPLRTWTFWSTAVRLQVAESDGVALYSR